ncbi:unnamed protein product [Spirodela intermedia]|uniref:Uncharacterized protein n=1 Tax=Spirodela intermedia TaxID=51605 RepID=A0A7I8JTY1_SPIIN|nr:unnamed protein product [Spirodela intermedia]CAA6673640.1 unnamed protein product [Spirodela intermedia]
MLLQVGSICFHGYHPGYWFMTHFYDGERDPSPSAQETPAVRVQPDRRAKTKEPGFRYTA